MSTSSRDQATSDDRALPHPPLQVLGPVQVMGPAGAVALGRERSRALLALLARQPGRDNPLEVLAEDLADTSGPPPSRASVRTYLSRLRARLADAEGRVRIPDATDRGYRIEADGTDHLELARLARSAERRLVVQDLRGAADSAERALALRRGRPYEGIDLPAIDLHRAELESTLLRLEDLRIHALLDLGEHERLIPEIEMAVAHQPLREERTCFLMLARYRSGRQRDALAAVQALRSDLAEAGLAEPTPGVRDLERRILDQDPRLDRWAEELPVRATALSVESARGTGGGATAETRRWAPADPPLIGRRRELDQLEACFDETVSSAGCFVMVSGEAGIGKTRLVQEMADRLEARGAAVHWGRCFEAEATAPHRPVVAALRSLLDARTAWAAEELGPRELDISLLLPELASTTTSGQAPLGDEQIRARDAATRLVVQASRHQPLALVFEDLHWGDRSSLLLLGHLARHTIDERVVLVATLRPEETAGRPISSFLSALHSDRAVTTVPVTGLDPGGVAALAASTAGRTLDDVDQLMARTAGNPFFVREITRLHADPEAAASAESVPESVLALLERRLARMAPSAIDLVGLVAAAPGGAPLELLAAVSDRRVEHLVDDLELAIDAGVLKEAEESGVGVIDVTHPLFREAANHRLTRVRRMRLHDRLATGLEPMAERDPERWLGELAHHAHWARPTGEASRARRASRAAADLAMRRTAYDQAAIHLTHALQALDAGPEDDPVERVGLLLAAAQAHHRAGAAEARTDAAAQAFAAAIELGEGRLAAEAALVHGGTRSTYGQPSVATVRLLERAAALLEAENDPASTGLRARVIARLAQESYHVGDYEAAERRRVESRTLAHQTGEDAVLAACAEGEVWALYHPDQAETRLTLTTEMAERAARADEREWETMALVWRASTCLELGRVLDIDRDLARLEELAEVVRAPSHLFRAATMTATRAIMSGRFDEGAAQAEVARGIGVEIERENADHTFAAQLLGMLREQGALVGLLPMVEQLADRYRATPGWRCALAWAFLHAGEPDRAGEELAALATDDFASIPFDLAWVSAHTYLAETASVLGDRDRAGVLYARLAPYDGLNASILDIVSNGAVAHFLGLLAAVQGDLQQAEAHLRAAVVFNDATNQRPAAARTRMELARVLVRRRGATSEADELLATVGAEAAALGLVQLRDDVSRFP